MSLMVARRSPARPAKSIWVMPLDSRISLRRTRTAVKAGPKEFWGAWDDETTHYQVHGTKRAGRERMIPRPGYVPRPTVTLEGLKTRLRRVSGIVTPYDARRTYMNLLVEIELPRPRRKLYLGHGAKDSADLYERPEIMDWIVADGKKLAGLVGHLLTPRLHVSKAG